ncbi:beta-1,4-N-acetylgalactosaminyltransferase bre-4-like [Mercenaria mercenaria]|uniref:beta-1,4-N-acetylgalactosaminyltransferase bre-4-like n=1 Tax=Mercenaria mercenaria TaxID=6596 RepID=UPI00234E6B54|nr:beta-1,4-N-acetylgalactosaminyltransferase bre-4-like [Mercenaria mercenaria]XP_053381590.1 beta-1,4-N-acetylgalactosaminyltransferase bre-4-like [Mercenaria mercenaria]XP_053381591.1 beta-1,4-N-acetylgalactosaminyltransferase bre-4-like [Mercenaria mercenaria]
MFLPVLMKWMKRFALLVLILYIVQICLLEIDVKSRIMITITQANSSMKEVRMVARSSSPNKEVRFITKFQSLQKEIRMKTRSTKESNRVTIVKNSLLNDVMVKHNASLEKPECFHNSTCSGGRVAVDISVANFESNESLFARAVEPGGTYTPTNCSSKQKTAIVVPYRDREEHLKIFLRHMHPFLQRQQLEYGIFIIEMDKNLKFNRAVLLNIGFVEAMKRHNYTCFVFHDVDLLPEDDRIPYSCANMPQHLSVAVDKLNYRLPYESIFGGACSIQTEHFRRVNGMSNMFFGWGGEDDDFSKRIRLSGLRIVRPSIAVARYKMIKHTEDPNKNPDRYCLLESTRQRMRNDGLSNLKYSVKQFELRRLYTWILVSVNETEQVETDSYLFKFYKACSDRRKRYIKNENRKTNTIHRGYSSFLHEHGFSFPSSGMKMKYFTSGVDVQKREFSVYYIHK